MVFTEEGEFREYPEDAEEFQTEKPGVAWKIIGLSTVAGLVLIAIWIVIATRATWYDLALTICVAVVIMVVCWVISIYWIAWRPNRRDDN